MKKHKGKLRGYASGGFVEQYPNRAARIDAAVAAQTGTVKGGQQATQPTATRRNITPIMNPAPSEAAARGSLRNTAGLVGAQRLPGYGPNDRAVETYMDKDYISGQRNFARGGAVKGPGTGTSDSIPAMLSNGEYVLRAKAVQKIGRKNLDKANVTGRMPKRMSLRERK